MAINLKAAKKLRQALKTLPKHYSADTVYVTEVHKGKTFDYFANQSGAADSPQDVGNSRIGRHDKLTVRTHPECYRAVYQRAKDQSAGRSITPNNWGQTEQLWVGRDGFLPDSRTVECTPRAASGDDCSGDGRVDDGVSEVVQTNA